MALIRDTQSELDQEPAGNYWKYEREHIRKLWDAIQEAHEDIMEVPDTLAEHYETAKEAVRQIMVALADKDSRDKNSYEKIPLPRIQIPQFGRDYAAWTNVEKMQHLKTNLRVEASKLIQHLPISEANYNDVWLLLTNRYQNKRLLLSKQLDNIFNLPKIGPNAPDVHNP
ncbi:uncharacterized protein LOC116165664 [Photinus pyralis]|uniref:uncharacterized protein LOC116165524 n=1 Tax=Photinus pyralis TaxID=7054 RepID=UPI0012677708|nr:uncharacterized protein LOC116165524 [Photinus pyralis]XP_031336155.1 uncharacterized protein LOC116165664 [Photinus pyralis]